MAVARFIIIAATLSLATSPVYGQSFAQHIAMGDSLTDAVKPAEALEHYRAAFLADAGSYEAMWKFARAQVDVAKQLESKKQRKQRDSLLFVARLYADAAVKANPKGAEGHFMLANALGRISRTKKGKERVQFGREIYNEAAEALALDPDHDGAHHVIGAWHAEIKRLSGATRFFAKTFLGGGFMKRASWDSSVVHLQRAIELKPDYVFHHLELAEVLVDLKRYDEARRQLALIPDLPILDVLDPSHKKKAAKLLEKIRDKKGGD